MKNRQDSQKIAKRMLARALAKGWTADQTLDSLELEQVDLGVISPELATGIPGSATKLIAQLHDCVVRKKAA